MQLKTPSGMIGAAFWGFWKVSGNKWTGEGNQTWKHHWAMREILGSSPPESPGLDSKAAQNLELCTRQKELYEMLSFLVWRLEKGHPTSQREWGKFHVCFLFVRFPMQAPGQPCRDGVAKTMVAVQAPIIQGGNPCLWPKELSQKYGETPDCFFPLSSLPPLGSHGSLVGE